MISRTLARRLEELELRIRAEVSEPIILRLAFVEGDGTVVGHREFTLSAPAPSRPFKRKRAR